MKNLFCVCVLCFCTGSFAQVLPDLERMPETVYAAPVTPDQAAEMSALRASNRLARAAHREAMQRLASRVGAPTGTTYEAVLERASALNAIADAVDADAPVDGMTGAGAAAVAAAVAGFLAGRKTKGT